MPQTVGDYSRIQYVVASLKEELKIASDQRAERETETIVVNEVSSTFSGTIHQLNEAFQHLDARVETYFPPLYGASHPFAEVAASLSAGIAKQIGEKLGRDRLAILRHKLNDGHPFLDILGLLQKSRDENANSSLIRFLLDPATAPNVAPCLLWRLAEFLELPPRFRTALEHAIHDKCISVFRERVLQDEGAGSGNLDRIDILISGPNFLIAIENKVDAIEHIDQTQDYWAWLQGREQSGCFVAALFLSPAGIPASCAEFRPASYLDLLAWLVDAPAEHELERIVQASYLRTILRLISFPMAPSHPVWRFT